MPNRKPHLRVASLSGAAAASIYAVYNKNNLFNSLVYASGGILGAKLTASLADMLDPPISPNHRSVGHAVIPNTVIYRLYKDIYNLINRLNTYAEEFDKNLNRYNPQKAFLCRLFAGFLIGLVSGHITHLAMDANSVKGLPWVCKEF